MFNSKQLFHDFVSKINLPIDREELHSIAYRVFEKTFGLSRTDILAEKLLNVSVEQHATLDEYVGRIHRHEPVQYILNEADFYGRRFFVDNAVLIPRPETEELVRMVIEQCRTLRVPSPKILDIGTGSGCIPITLALEMPSSQVYALDKSKDALKVAERNAKALNVNVDFFELDILTDQLPLEGLDVIVSNPPYIAREEEHVMSSNVKDFEPHLALFVENNNPLIFYSAIAKAGVHALNVGGFLAVEINERFGAETKAVFENTGFVRTTVVKDISGKDRVVLAWKR